VRRTIRLLLVSLFVLGSAGAFSLARAQSPEKKEPLEAIYYYLPG